MTPDLAALQARLLTGLADGQAPEVLRQAVHDGGLADWADGWDPDLLELAGLLVRTWAVTDAVVPSAGVGGEQPVAPDGPAQQPPA